MIGFGAERNKKLPMLSLNLRAEKIVTCREKDRGLEGDINLDLFTTRRPFAVVSLAFDAIDHGVLDREGRDLRCDKTQGTVTGIACGSVDFHVRRRVLSGRHVLCADSVRV